MTPEEATKEIVSRFTLVGDNCTLTVHDTEILEIVRIAIREERERCAKIAESLDNDTWPQVSIAAAIRSNGEPGLTADEMMGVGKYNPEPYPQERKK